MKLPNSFAFKASALFLLLLLLMGAAQAYLTLRISKMRQAELEQLINWNLAREMSRELSPIEKSATGLNAVEPAIHYMMVLNPTIEVYILNEGGKILAYFMETGSLERDRVETGPLEEFIAMNRRAPISGDDPRNSGRMKPFSADHVTFSDGSRGYLYIILRSSSYDRADMALQENVLARALTGAFFFSLIGVGIVGLVLFSKLTRRLSLLTRGVKALEAGELDTTIDPGGHDEIGELGHVFNEMAATIRQNLEELRAADRLHRELAANISHDLRSPLTSIQGYIETLLMKYDDIPSDTGRRYLEIIMGESRKLSSLIDDLFQLSLLETDKVELEMETFSLTELLQDELLLYKARAGQKGIKVDGRLPRDLLPVRGDLKLIRRVLTNLLDNALTYTPPGGLIEVSAESLNERIRVEVRDSGAGIPEKDRVHIFSRFYRGEDQPADTTRSGSGLGLAIAKRIMELHSGRIGVMSTEGEGSLFFLEFLPA